MKMNYLDIEPAFRYYKKMYQLLNRFDRPVGYTGRKIMLKIIWLFNFIHIHRLIRAYLLIKSVDKLDSRIVSFVFSNNHLNILNSIRYFEIELPSYFIGEIRPVEEKDLYISNKRILLEALSIGNLYKLLKEAESDNILRENFVRVFKVIGCYKIFTELSKNHKYILNFNDHMPYSVLLHDIAKKNGNISIYMQHASVSDKFPALYHDHNILFSKDSEDKYENPSCKDTHILFDPRFSSLQEVKVKDRVEGKILICTNLLDDPKKVKELTILLQKDYEIVVRPHPRDKRKDWNKLDLPISTELSVWQDLKKSEILITNESAVILEGIFCDCLVYKAAFFGTSLDNYGYLKKGLINREHTSPNSLVMSIENKIVEYDKQKLPYFIGELKEPKNRIREVFNNILKKDNGK